LHGDEAKGAAYYDQFPAAIVPEDVARTILFALDQPPHVTITQLVVMPTKQE
jgi:NADP-dependent 3-hydroxy acid dehydrogenase YdfG